MVKRVVQKLLTRNDKENEVTLLYLIGITVACALWEGVVLAALWGWFMVPALSLPAISVVEAVGIVLVVNLLTHQHVPREEDELKELIIFGFMMPLVALIMGAFFQMAM